MAGARWNEFALAFARAQVLASLYGRARAARQARLLGVEMPFDDQEVDENVARFQRTKVEFEPGPFLEAVRGFADKVPRLRPEVNELVNRARAQAQAIVEAEQAGVVDLLAARSPLVDRAVRGSFFVTGADKTTTVDLKALIAQAIRGQVSVDEAGEMVGLNLSQFVEEAQLAGASNLTKFRLQTIYRNNLSSAYNDAQVRVLDSEPVRRLVPLMQLTEIRDRRTRGNPNGFYPDKGFHWQMNGFVGTIDDFRRLGIVPPNGHNCRGGLRALSLAESRRRGFVTAEGVVDRAAVDRHNGERLAILRSGQYPDPGFKELRAA